MERTLPRLCMTGGVLFLYVLFERWSHALGAGFALLAPNLALTGALALLLWRWPLERARGGEHPAPHPARSVLPSSLIPLLAACVLTLFAWRWPRPSALGSMELGSALAISTLIPLNEELLFRGWILDTLRRAMPSWIALLLSSALFAAFHLPQGPIVALTMLALGLVLGVTRLRTDSLLLPIALHAAWNGLSCLVHLPRGATSLLFGGLLSLPLLGLSLWMARGALRNRVSS